MCSPQVMKQVRDEMSRRRFLGRVGAAGAITALGATALASRGTVTALQGDATPVASPVATSTAGLAALAAGGFTSIYDLSHVHGPEFPMFPGAQQMQMNVLVNIATDGYFKWELILDEHTGTHMDAPAHFVEDGLSAELLPVENFVAPLAVIDITDRAATDPDAQLTPDDIAGWESANGSLPAGAFVAMHSGWATKVDDPAAFLNQDANGVPHFPGIHPDAAALLVNERDIVGVGVDTVSLDFGAATVFDTHVILLAAGKYGLENVAALDQLPPSGATIIVGGPKHRDASGGPTRVYALT